MTGRRHSRVEPVEKAVADALGRIGVAPADLILIALSGGPDSVALTSAIVARREQARQQLAAAHLNHHLRGAESDRDEVFVRELCARLGISLHVGHAELGADSANLEERARDARYLFLNRIADETGARYIAVAHHADDQAETVMMRLIRGTGLDGLAGMAERGPGRIVRPMLSIRRDEIICYLESIGALFVRDSSNLSLDRTRNRIRTTLIPAVDRDYSHEYGAGFAGRLVALSREMGAMADFVAGESARALDSVIADDGRLDLDRFAALHPALAAAVMREFARRQTSTLRMNGRIHFDLLMELASGSAGSAAIDLPGGWTARREYGRLEITRRIVKGAVMAPESFRLPIARNGRTDGPGFAFEAATFDRPENDIAESSCGQFEARFDADRMTPDLEVRSFQAGDRIRPLGMIGSQKVKQVFIDRKIAQAVRSLYPIVTIGGEIAWIPGVMRARVALLDADTRLVLRIETIMRGQR